MHFPSYTRNLVIGLLATLAFASPVSFLQADPVISEFVADNVTGIRDEDNAVQDWLEIHNPSLTSFSLTGWYLTDSAFNLTQWAFPAVTLAPGEFLTVWASGKNRRVAGQPLHTNFSLAKDGEYLALVRPNGTTVAQQFSPVYPKQDPDRSYGYIFNRTPMVTSGANTDYLIPAVSTALASNWRTATTSPAGWTLARPMGIGFGYMVPGLTQTIRAKNTSTGTLDTQAAALTLVNRPAGHVDIRVEHVSIVPSFNLLGEGADGRFPNNRTVPSGVLDDYVARVTGTITIPTGGVWTFGLNSDDGGRIVINGAIVMDDPSLHGPQDFLGRVTLAAGNHSIDAWFWERGGGDEGELFAAPGNFTAWDPSFRLVGDTANGGLAAFTNPIGSASTAGAVVSSNIETTMRNVNASAFMRIPFTNALAATPHTSLSLLMRSNDGFLAYLNGNLAASRNAPSTPAWNSTATAVSTEALSQQWVGYNLTSLLAGLPTGGNMLAIQGLNISAADATFLQSAQLIAGSLPAAPQPAFFNTVTPAAINDAPSSLGKVADTTFLPKRGFYPDAVVTTTPFNVSISTTTPGASIRYTTDGSTPSETVGTLYTGPISVSSTTVIRALAYRAGWESTNIDTHSYLLLNDVITQSSTGAPPTGAWPAAGAAATGQIMDYGMDPDIVNSTNTAIGGATQVKAALMAIPTLSLVTDLPKLFGTDGIYLNPYARGFGSERSVSLELLNDPAGGFQLDCGARMRGGYSRSTDNPKHAWHFYFRDEYGPGKLRYPLFGYNGAEEFNQLDLRTAQNYSWSFGGDGQNTFLREEFCRQTQIDMGNLGSQVKYMHLYINGQYWGLFNTDERKEADHCSTYLGGDKINWDVIKCEQSQGYITGFTDGNTDAWNLLFTKLNPLTSPGIYTRRSLTPAEYYDLQGLAADGVTPNTSPVLLDVNSLIDYMLVTFWTGNFDGATSAFLGDLTANNWFAARDRTKRQGFRYFVHDFEHSLFNTAEDRTGPFVRTFTDLNTYNEKRTYYNPMFIHADLLDVPAYKLAWQQRVQKHLFNGGPLTLAANTARLNKLASVVDSAIIAESARWGDSKSATPLNRQNWIGSRDNILNGYLPFRTASVIAQLRADGLYPAVDGIQISPPGGYTTASTSINLTGPGPAGYAYYYTVNGTDPLLPNGTLNPAARLFTAANTVRSDIIASGTSWRYRDPSIDLGSSSIVAGDPAYNATNWKHPSFDMSNTTIWKTGNAELGAGDAVEGRPEATLINIGAAGSRYPVVYFRKQFTVADPTVFEGLELEALIDDGAIFYINGREVARLSMPAGAVGYATTNIGAANEAAFVTVTDSRLLPSVLVPGLNTICVQVHQTNLTSSDLSFDLRLRGRQNVIASPVQLGTGAVTVRARALETATNFWSAMSEATFLVQSVPASASNLVISELHYHPQLSGEDVTAGYPDENLFEYIELQNIGNAPVDLMGIRFVEGIDFTWDSSTPGSRLVVPGGRVVLAGNALAFARRHGSSVVPAGIFAGQLDNGGERLLLLAADGSTIRDFSYSDAAPWPTPADAGGPSLVLLRPDANPNHSLATSWRPSIAAGTPGQQDSFSYGPWKAANAATQSNGEDADKDGLTTVWEYLLGGTPGVNNSKLLPTASAEVIDAGNGPVTYDLLSVTLRPGVDDVVITPLSSPDLRLWDGSEMQEHSIETLADGSTKYTFRHQLPRGGEQRRFFRLEATLIP